MLSILKIKQDRMNDLPKFGFREGPKYWDHLTESCKVGKESREFGIVCQGYASRVPGIVVELIKADMVEVEEE